MPQVPQVGATSPTALDPCLESPTPGKHSCGKPAPAKSSRLKPLPQGRAGGGGGVSRSLHDPQRVVPLRQQFGFARLRLVQVRFLDVTVAADVLRDGGDFRSEEHTSELQSLMRISY